MKAVFVVGSVLVFAAGTQLFVLTRETEHWFAWTISVPLTAAFLGAFYWTALAVAVQSFLRRTWVEARVGVPGVLVFVSLTFVVTLIHRDKFHFGSTDDVARGAAYLWFVVYLIDPLFVAIAWILQRRHPGADPPRRFLIPGWYRAGLAVQAAVLLTLALLLLVVPDTAADFWPWPLTPLTSRAIGAWLTGIGLVIATAWWENAWERIEIAALSYAVLGLLQLVALARFRTDVNWSALAAPIYLAALCGIVAFGLVGYWLATQARRPHQSGTR
jgi:hypothetical protein